MLLLLTLVLPAVAADDVACGAISAVDIVQVQPPAVIVLGERRGTLPDLTRAANVARSLRVSGPVTVAIEAVRAEHDPVLQGYRADVPNLSALPAQIDWDTNWAYPFEPYRDLLTLALTDGYSVVAVGSPLAPPAGARAVDVPSGYSDHLATIAGSTMPVGMRPRLAKAMAWTDHQIATAATQGWDGKGYLVILTDRTRVEGGFGVNWQVEQITNRPVHSFVLGWGDPPCHEGDLVWKQPVWRAQLPLFMIPRD